MASSNCSSKITWILFMATCALGGALANSSFSQNGQRTYDGTEVGRYQWVAGAIFDTKTARLWRFVANGQIAKEPNGVRDDGRWVWDHAPWEWNRTTQNRPTERRLPHRGRGTVDDPDLGIPPEEIGN
jgi:hypothetical protein